MPRPGRAGTLLLALTFVSFSQTNEMTVVSAASFARGLPLAPGMIVTAFSAAVPDESADFTVFVRDVASIERNAAVVSRSRGQISFVVPSETALGAGTITLMKAGGVVASAQVSFARVSPGLFTANASGDGPPAGLALHVLPDGSREFSNLFEQWNEQGRFEPRPFDVRSSAGEFYLMLFGTGLRGAADRPATARIGGVAVPVQALQAQGTFEGLDQVNLGPLPKDLGTRGVVDLTLTVDGIPANVVAVAPTLPSSGNWGRRGDLPEANSEMSVAGSGGAIYVFGGYPASRVTVPTVQVYDIATDSWSLTTPLPIPVNHSMAAAVNGKLYVIGGQTDANVAYVNNVQEYDPATRAWRQRAPMPSARGGGAAAVIDGKIYVAGGRPPRGADFAVYDPAQDQWTPLPNLPTQRNHLAAAAIAGKLYVVGGRFEGGFQSAQTGAVEIYDPRTNTWTEGAPMPKSRGGINAVEARGCLHVFGGEFTAGVHPDHDVYNPFTNSWSSAGPMPVPVHGVTGAVFADGLIYLPGGGTSQGGSSGSRIHQVYRPNVVCR